ncbi:MULTISPECIES: hypothetical protein [Flammeovirga]|uniref:Carboxypeptidase regulatory-like domain-containing protein n=1 Tax=Flammeovirga agarivorans TaxID=2726742 RepID=A0A7X8XUU7_9BACT|nr:MULTISPECIES: hypothetical protein [Flammeovirga]NLR90708.1 hypothetical protein [Flammeovirga agarivorans]
MRKFISKLSIIISLIGLTFILHSCSETTEEPNTVGTVTIHISDLTSYSDGEVIELRIVSNKDTIQSGSINQLTEVIDCQNTPSNNGVYSVQLPTGSYKLVAYKDNKSYIFGNENGTSFNISTDDCTLISLGEADFEQEILNGNVTFFANSSVGFSKQPITITITDKNDDEVTRGVLRQYANSPDCGLETANDVFTIDLPAGNYNVYAVEADSDDTQGAWFTGLEGYSLTIEAGSCQRFVLGEDPFEEQDSPNARIKKGLKILTIKPFIEQ